MFPTLRSDLIAASANVGRQWQCSFVKKVRVGIACRLLQRSNIGFKAEVAFRSEERHTRWTTHGDTKAWFENRRMELEHLGFGTTRCDGSFCIPEDQLCRIVNLDESTLLLDGNDGRCRGRPRVTLHDPWFPCCSNGCSKSSITTTLIGGNLSLGQPLPPHFQCVLRANTDDARVNEDVFKCMRKARALF